jgi:hypothetical protein
VRTGQRVLRVGFGTEDDDEMVSLISSLALSWTV